MSYFAIFIFAAKKLQIRHMVYIFEHDEVEVYGDSFMPPPLLARATSPLRRRRRHMASGAAAAPRRRARVRAEFSIYAAMLRHTLPVPAYATIYYALMHDGIYDSYARYDEAGMKMMSIASHIS